MIIIKVSMDWFILYALEHEYTIIRISQEDIYYDRINWQEILEKTILEIQDNEISSKKIFISLDDNLYFDYIYKF